MRLRRNEFCPIHKSRYCCGRKQRGAEHRLNTGIRRIEDPHHPRGYRELRSPAEMRKLLNRKVVEQDRRCAICHDELTDYNDIVPDHIVTTALRNCRPRILTNVQTPPGQAFVATDFTFS